MAVRYGHDIFGGLTGSCGIDGRHSSQSCADTVQKRTADCTVSFVSELNRGVGSNKEITINLVVDISRARMDMLLNSIEKSKSVDFRYLLVRVSDEVEISRNIPATQVCIPLSRATSPKLEIQNTPGGMRSRSRAAFRKSACNSWSLKSSVGQQGSTWASTPNRCSISACCTTE